MHIRTQHISDLGDESPRLHNHQDYGRNVQEANC